MLKMKPEQIGEFIASMRKEHNLTQEELAGKLNVANKTVGRWETGKYMPDIGKLEELSALLGVSVDELIAGKRMEKTDEKTDEAVSENIARILQDRIDYFKLQWLKERKWYIALCISIWSAILAIAVYTRESLIFGGLFLCGLSIFGYVRNRMMSYVEQHAFKR